MQIIAVTDQKTAKEFIETAGVLHKHDPNWIRPLDKDINDVFDKQRIKLFALEMTVPILLELFITIS